MENRRTPFHVGCILDEFSYHCFSPEGFLEPIPFKNISQIPFEKYDFILCESVWNAINSNISFNKTDLKYGVTYQWLQSLIKRARSLGIPTVFWNKEDNYHFQGFLPVAKLFDHIFTTDERCLRDYRSYCPQAKTIEVLMFASQPTYHNPIGLFSRKYRGDVFFPGSWYNDKTERNMELLEFLTVSNEFKVDIYDRRCQDEKKKPDYPRAIWSRVYPGMPYQKIRLKYFEYPSMYNINTVLGSPTMFARRVPEALACGTAVISPPSEAIENYFVKNVFYATTKEETEEHLRYIRTSIQERRKEVLQSIRHVHIFHTYLNRFLQIIAAIQKPYPPLRNSFALLVVPHPKHSSTFTFSFVTIARTERLDLNQPEQSRAMIREIFSEKEQFGYVAVVYEGNEYSPLYLCDMYHAFQYTECLIVGKECVQTPQGLLHEGMEHKYSSNLHPHTLCFSLQDRGNLEEVLLSTLGLIERPTEEYPGYAVAHEEFVYHPERFFLER